MNNSPTIRLLLGLLVTLAAVTGSCWYSLHQLKGLRRLQTDIIDLDRHDNLRLLQVQNDLNGIGLALRDMTQEPKGSGIVRYRAEFDRLRLDLSRTIRREARLKPVRRPPAQQPILVEAFHQFWISSDAVFAEAAAGHETAARNLAATSLHKQQADLATLVSTLLERNNAAEEQADRKISYIYDGAERDVYVFLAATILAILVTSLYLIYSNRQIFARIESLSSQRRVLAARLITVQEEVLRSVSRELHDEFGQILTAVGAMLARADKKGLPPDSPFRTELTEVRQITHDTLEKIRSLSQMLHPVVIDDYGLAKAVEWYTGVFEKQTGIEASTRIVGVPVRVTGPQAIHSFRIVQEALTNAAKHSGTKRAAVEMKFTRDSLVVSIEDFGHGFTQPKKDERSGLGFIAMRERAELTGGTLDIVSAPGTGTTVSLVMPLKKEDPPADLIGETEDKVLTPNL